MARLLKKGKTSGPVFYDEDGELLASEELSKFFILEILKVKREREDLVPCNWDEVLELYNVRRSLRRESQTRTREEGMASSVIGLVI